MTELLKKIFEEISKFPDQEQDEIAISLGKEIEWKQSFIKSQDQLAKLADEALSEFYQGKTKPLEF